MTQLQLRPRFILDVSCDPQTLQSALAQRLSERSENIRGSVYHTSCVLRIPPERAHFWSPQLQLSLDPREDGHTLVHGLYGPRPAIWSLFLALYVAVGFVGVMGIIFGYSQSLLGDPALAYWSGPGAIVLAIVIYAVARQGRRLGYAQMVELRAFLDSVISEYNPITIKAAS